MSTQEVVNMLKPNGFVGTVNNFSGYADYEVLDFFHHYKFRDDNGHELVACKDFIALVNQACSKQGVSDLTPAELVIKECLSRYVNDKIFMYVKGL
ncbi:MAG: hypothetical protein EKE20_15975 [Candidatus Symbiopectobacterium sp. Dall1.0]|nr:hypothetical protein [Candidatus Symbiopectobacterium sp. Dall1.0]